MELFRDNDPHTVDPNETHICRKKVQGRSFGRVWPQNILTRNPQGEEVADECIFQENMY